MLKEYFKLQKEYENKYGEKTVLLMQVGGFYEVYCTDIIGFSLKELSSILNIQYTKKNKAFAISEKSPYMLGFPVHSLKKYLKILVDNQFTVAVHHQEENKKGVVTRHKTGIYTYATYIDDIINNDTPTIENNIIALFIDNIDSTTYHISASQIDLFTGKGSVLINEYTDEMKQYSILQHYLQLFKSKEIVYTINNNLINPLNILDNLDIDTNEVMIQRFNLVNQANINYQNEVLEKVYGKETLISQIERLGLEKYPNLVTSWIMLIDYVYEHNPKIIQNIDIPEIIKNDNHLLLENNAVEQLNLISNNSLEMFKNNKKFQSVYHVINNCVTCIGKRYLKIQLLRPLTDITEINNRYDATEYLKPNEEKLTDILQGIVDIEKLNRRMSLELITPFELKNLYLTYKKLSTIQNFKWDCKFLIDIPSFDIIDNWEKYYNFDTFDDEKYFINGVYPHLDKLKNIIDSEYENISKFHQYLNKKLNDYEKKEINGIKLEFNDKDGYYFSLSVRRANNLKQLLTDKELHTLTFKQMPKSQVMKLLLNEQLDRNVLNEYRELNKKCWIDSCNKMYNKHSLKAIVNWISKLDFILSNIKTAKMYKYTKPIIEQADKSFVNYTEMRHPIIERLVKDTQPYVCHDIILGKKQDGILLYGLNSAGKSSIMKAIGINIILAQCGLYVPCKKMVYNPYTALYTRITGNDNIFKGLSSFSLEMVELNNIVKCATKNSLIIGDEICRGTETISACSIVSSILIILAQRKASFIFASHLHDLVKITDISKLSNLKVFHLKISIDENNQKIIYDRQLTEGSGENIYGVTIAKFIIKDLQFTILTDKMIEIHKQLYDQGHKNGDKIKLKLVNDKKSRYNSKKFVSNCENCGKKASYKGELETHHSIIKQEQCDEDGYYNHLHKNNVWNLKILCNDCHEQVH